MSAPRPSCSRPPSRAGRAIALAAVGVAFAGVGCGGGAAATRSTKVAATGSVNLGSWKSQLTVFTDGKSRYVAAVLPDPEREKDPPASQRLFYGDGKTFEAQDVSGYDATGMKFEIGYDDPRIPSSPIGTLARTQGKITLSCASESVELTQLPAADAAALVSKATFRPNRNEATPVAYAEDDTGRSIVVLVRGGGKEAAYELIVGKPGSVSRQPVTRFDHDESWTNKTWVTREGSLELVGRMDEGKGVLTLKKKTTNLKVLDRTESWAKMAALGVVPARTGTPCDDLYK